MKDKIFGKEKIDGPRKTIIRNDWLREFPEYRSRRPCSIAKRVGPVVLALGWEVSHGVEYRPGSSVCNYMNVEKSTYAGLSCESRSRKDITWDQHEKGLYLQAVHEIKEGSPVPLEGPLSFRQLMKAYDKAVAEGGGGMKKYEDPILLLGWAGMQKEAVAKAAEMAAVQKGGTDHLTEEKRKKWFQTVDAWEEAMIEKASNKDRLHALVEAEIVRYKLEKLPYQDLIMD